ncbi:MAG: glycosyltransferase family 2 protein [Thermoanaerobaculia bacterium]|nr:glycosyltransferase family 2 protein [Thermoanaerobaculia bacterium]
MSEPQQTVQDTPRVGALVINFNGKDVTLQTLESLAQLEYQPLDLVVIDNGSTDGSRLAIAERFPQVTQLEVRENHGISHGMNVGLRHALEEGYDYTLILNNDIEVDSAMVTEMVTLAESDLTIGAVGPKAFYYGDRERLWSTGGILRWAESVTNERGDQELDRGQYDRDEEVDYVNGCAMLVRREALERTGFWDATYFLGVEDADWCVRMKQQGFTCWYAHRAKLWHMISHSTGVYKPFRTFQTGRSTAIFVRKFAGPLGWLRFLVLGALAIPAAFLRELPKGNQKAAIEKLRGYFDGLRVPIPDQPAVTSPEAGS